MKKRVDPVLLRSMAEAFDDLSAEESPLGIFLAKCPERVRERILNQFRLAFYAGAWVFYNKALAAAGMPGMSGMKYLEKSGMELEAFNARLQANPDEVVNDSEDPILWRDNAG